jgi:hypothetical protein
MYFRFSPSNKCKVCLGILTCLLLCFFSSAQSREKVTQEQSYSILASRKDTVGKAENPKELGGRVMCGYQGWFRATGDGEGLGFHHYERRGKFEPGFCSIDLWPDLKEFGEDEKFPTLFKHKDGRTAHVYSSIHPKTVDRHFRWMRDFEIDGVFVQRFATLAAKEHKSFRLLRAENQKLQLCRDSANRHGRAYALMYDLSGLTDDDFPRLAKDWKELRTRMQLGTDPHDKAYLQLNGKPLVGIWGVGFNDDRKYSLGKMEWFIRLLKQNPEWGGMSIVLGVPYGWRTLDRDSVADPHLHEILKLADVISPWSVGRYRDSKEVLRKVTIHQRADMDWCKSRNIDYLPVLFPGFSWRNMNLQVDFKKSFISREKGRFLWNQFVASRAAGNDSAYIAMFDEMDEGTAIFKCTNDAPTGKSVFQTFEGLPSDHYLWLTNKGRKLLRGELPSKVK